MKIKLLQTTIASKFSLLLIMLVLPFAFASAQSKSEEKVTLSITVVDSNGGEPLPGAVCTIDELGIYGVTDLKGVAKLPGVPHGKWKVKCQILGFKTIEKQMLTRQNLTLKLRMKEESLALEEVVVVAKRSDAGQATSQRIGRQAIDHIQATNLADLMQLIPGQVIQDVSNTMTSPTQVNIRSVLPGNKNNAFGVSVVMDGMPISNNASLSESSQFGSEGRGLDMRKIGTDNIESIEVITGVPSAEYGDLSAGAIIIHSKNGATPLRVRSKITPSVLQASAGKGWTLDNGLGVINTSLDYANSSSDPRKRTQSFNRISGNLTYSNRIGKWSPKLSVSYSGIIDKTKLDPDMLDDGTREENKDYSIRVSHDGRFAINKPLSRSIKYNIGFSYNNVDYRKTTFNTLINGISPLFDARENGYHRAVMVPASYLASGGSISKAFNFYSKVSNQFYVKTGILNQLFKMGVEYRYNKNNGIGKYNDNDDRPLNFSSSRPRKYSDIPALNQLSAYIEDNFDLKWDVMPIRFQAGLRYTALQPGKDISVSSISPRFNMSLSPAKWLDVRLAYGRNAKTPGMTHLYPDYKYFDQQVATVSGATSLDAQIWYQSYLLKPDNSKLKNSITNRYEIGLDFKLPKGRNISVTGFYDRNNSGFSTSTAPFILNYNYYSTSNGGITIDPDTGVASVDFENPDRTLRQMASSGEQTNNACSENKGIELSIDLGKVKALNTSFYVRGGWTRSMSFTKGQYLASPLAFNKTPEDPFTPFKFVYNSGVEKSIYESLNSSVQAVCNIPALEMVASFTAQVIWYNYNKTTDAENRPLGWIDNNLDYHEIPASAWEDPNYTVSYGGVDQRIADQVSTPVIKAGTRTKPVWLFNARLTKTIMKFMDFSFYVNNVNFYQPWLSSSTSDKETEKNLQNFQFGVELSLKL